MKIPKTEQVLIEEALNEILEAIQRVKESTTKTKPSNLARLEYSLESMLETVSALSISSSTEKMLSWFCKENMLKADKKQALKYNDLVKIISTQNKLFNNNYSMRDYVKSGIKQMEENGLLDDINSI